MKMPATHTKRLKNEMCSVFATNETPRKLKTKRERKKRESERSSPMQQQLPRSENIDFKLNELV